MDIYLATENPGKAYCLRSDLEKYGVSLVHYPIPLTEPRSNDVGEIARAKVIQAYSKILAPTIVIDAGFYIDSWNGFPGTYVNHALETLGLDGILKLVEGRSRECESVQCLAYMDAGLDEPKYFTSRVRGSLSDEPRGSMQEHLWSKLGLIFITKGSKQTLGEITYEESLKYRKSGEAIPIGQQLYDWISTREMEHTGLSEGIVKTVSLV